MLKKSGNQNEWRIDGKPYAVGSVTKRERTKGRKFFIPIREVETFPAVVVPSKNKKRKIFFTPVPSTEADIAKPEIEKANVRSVSKPRIKKWIDKKMVVEDGKKYKGRNNWRENSSAYLIALKNGWLDEVFPKKVQTKESVVEDSRNYKDRNEWRLKSFFRIRFCETK